VERPLRSSIVVVTHNHHRDIGPCLDAVQASIGAHDEVILVDNASSDGTADLVARLYPSVRVVRAASNLGFGGGCNLAARLSSARYLVFLNPDTQPLSGWLDCLLQGLQDVPQAGLATARLQLMSSPNRIDAVGHRVHLSGIATCEGWGDSSEHYQTVREVASVSGACFAIRRDLFEELDGFDAGLFLYYEDDDLSIRARLAGYTCVLIPNARVLHDHTPGISARKFRYLERNRWWSLLKTYRARTLVALAPVLFGAELVAWAFALTSGPGHVAAKAHAWWDVVRWLPYLPGARRAVQSRRKRSDAELLRLHGTRLSLAQVHSGRVVRVAEPIMAGAFGLGHALVTRVIAQ